MKTLTFPSIIFKIKCFCVHSFNLFWLSICSFNLTMFSFLSFINETGYKKINILLIVVISFAYVLGFAVLKFEQKTKMLCFTNIKENMSLRG